MISYPYPSPPPGEAGGEAAEAGPTEPKAEEGASKEEEQGATEDGVVAAPPTKGPPTAKVAPEN